MDWTVFVLFLLSITSSKCGKIPITSADEIEREDATSEPEIAPTTDVINTSTNNIPSEQVTDNNNATTSQTTENSGDIDVYYGFQALPVVVKFLGEDGRFHWYFAKEGIDELSSQSGNIQYGLNTPPSNPYFQFPWNILKPDSWFSSFSNNQHGLSMENPFFNPYFPNSFPGYNPYFSNPHSVLNPSLNTYLFNLNPEFNPFLNQYFPNTFLNPYLFNINPELFPSSDPYFLNPNPVSKPNPNPYLLNSYPEFNPYFTSALPQMSPNERFSDPITNSYEFLNSLKVNPYNYLSEFGPISNYLQSLNPFQVNPSQFNPYSSIHQPYPIYDFFNQIQTNPYEFLTNFPVFNPFLSQIQGLNNGYQYPFSHRFNPSQDAYYNKFVNKISPFNRGSPIYASINHGFKPLYMDSPGNTRSEYVIPLNIISSNSDHFLGLNHVSPVYTDTGNIHKNIPYFQSRYMSRSPSSYNSYNPNFLCGYPSNRPFLITSYDYINRLPLDPIYRCFVKVLITSLANLYPRGGYSGEPLYTYPYYVY